MAEHAHLKNAFTEDEKYHYLVSRLNSRSHARAFAVRTHVVLELDEGSDQESVI